MDARTTIPAFDAFLAERRLKLRATVIGGAALQLLGLIARPTKDCDVLDPSLPDEIRRAADDFALERQGEQLQQGWFNNGPASLLRSLPPQWVERLQPIYSGDALHLHTLGREDLLRSKLFAFVDRSIDLPDCVALALRADELRTLLPWLDAQDGNEQCRRTCGRCLLSSPRSLAMSYRRQIEPLVTLKGEALDHAMAGIGMSFAVDAVPYAAIEDVLFFASRLGMEKNDYRVLNVLCKWIDVHAARINADRLTRLVETCAEHERTRAFWAAVGQWQQRDRRFGRLAALRARGDRIDLFVGTDFQIRRHGGEHPWFAGTCLRVAAGTLRDRASDVATPERLVQLHPVYRERVVQGASYRADMWAALQLDDSLTPSELARRTYGSFAPAWEARRDWDVVHSVAA